MEYPMPSSKDNKIVPKSPEYIHILMEALEIIDELNKERQKSTKPISNSVGIFDHVTQIRKQSQQNKDFHDEAASNIQQLKSLGLTDYQEILDAILQEEKYKTCKQTAKKAPFAITEQDREEEAQRVETARLEAEEAQRAETARLKAEEAQRVETARLEAEEAQRVETARLKAEEAQRVTAARVEAITKQLESLQIYLI